MSHRPRCAAFALALALLFTACGSVVEPAESVNERWQYAGTQRLPALLQFEGTLRITQRSGARFEGALDLVRTNTAGEVERVAGQVRGRQDGDRVDFEALLDNGVVRHVGRALGDSVSGSWLDDSRFGGTIVSGTFVLRRRP